MSWTKRIPRRIGLQLELTRLIQQVADATNDAQRKFLQQQADQKKAQLMDEDRSAIIDTRKEASSGRLKTAEKTVAADIDAIGKATDAVRSTTEDVGKARAQLLVDRKTLKGDVLKAAEKEDKEAIDAAIKAFDTALSDFAKLILDTEEHERTFVSKPPPPLTLEQEKAKAAKTKTQLIQFFGTR